jgi:hypothetical protein
MTKGNITLMDIALPAHSMRRHDAVIQKRDKTIKDESLHGLHVALGISSTIAAVVIVFAYSASDGFVFDGNVESFFPLEYVQEQFWNIIDRVNPLEILQNLIVQTSQGFRSLLNDILSEGF